MRNRSPRTIGILVVGCCCLVLLATFAHLLHPVHTPHTGQKHGKAVADDVCFFCVYCIAAASPAGYIPPQFAVGAVNRPDPGEVALHATALLRVQIGRAPPAFV